MEIIIDILKQTLMVVVFVIVMMLVLEYITLRTKNRTFKTVNNPWLKIVFAAVMGALPGCMGTFAVVSMYVHRNLGLAALTAAMIATAGDETFVMLSIIPGKSFLIMGIIFIVAIVIGFIIRLLNQDKNYSGKEMHIHTHKDSVECVCYDSQTLLSQLKNIIWERAVVVVIALLFLASLIISGAHGAEGAHSHADSHSEWGWEKITFMIVTIVGLAISLTVPDHFLKKHLWNHIIKKHFLKLFLWTLGAFSFMYILNQFVDIENWVKSNIDIVMLLAILIGIIPTSGPNLIFISLFVGGVIPISVLIANSIVQDGNGSIPLLAESQKSFLITKGINVLAGLLVGYSMLLAGI